MYPVLILLVLLNATLFAWGFFWSPDAQPGLPSLVEPSIPALELRQDVGEVVYRSSAAGTQSSYYTLGPYNSAKAAQLVAEKIQGFGLAVNTRPMRSMETLNFLVYVPPLPDEAEAHKVVDDLTRSAVQDASLITDGPYRNAISLGFFNNLNKAKRHAEYIRYLGYDARYTEQQTPREVFWLDYDEPFGSNAPVQTWSAAIDATSDVQRIPRACQ